MQSNNLVKEQTTVITQQTEEEKGGEQVGEKREMVGEMDVKGVVESVGQICNVCLAITSDLEDHSR